MTVQLLQAPVRNYALTFVNLLFVIANHVLVSVKHADVIVNLTLAFETYALRVVKLALVIVKRTKGIVNNAQVIINTALGNC